MGFVGAGRIGFPMVSRLVGAGHRVQVVFRSREARTALTEEGALPCPEVVDVAAGAETVVVCVYDDEQVREVVLDSGLLDAMPTGSVLVVHTTGSPATIARLVERAGRRGIEVVDAPVSGGPHDVAAGHVTLYAGGTEEGMARARPVMSVYGLPIVHCGPPGSGQLVKLVNNAVFAANIGVVAAAVRLANQLGIEENLVVTGLQHGSAASRVLDGIAVRASVAAYAHNVGEFVGKDVAVVRGVAAGLGADLGLLADAHRVLGDLLSPEQRVQLIGFPEAVRS
ncbi:NAD(P)-dependent oxidoreductase [Streptomyces sp. NPDC048251]|uniref:NAD(P)-dependent oxidoreductase n=1 Tax=Streptomyces sp. NPDC048251 TaxID=3154501 RepID=UPI00341EE101